DAALIAGRAAVGGVVHLEHQVGAGGDVLAEGSGPAVGGAARGVDQKDVAVGPEAAAAQTFLGEGDADRRTTQPGRARWADIDHGVVYVGAAGGADFAHLDPAAGGEAGGDDLVGVVHRSVSGD